MKRFLLILITLPLLYIASVTTVSAQSTTPPPSQFSDAICADTDKQSLFEIIKYFPGVPDWFVNRVTQKVLGGLAELEVKDFSCNGNDIQGGIKLNLKFLPDKNWDYTYPCQATCFEVGDGCVRCAPSADQQVELDCSASEGLYCPQKGESCATGDTPAYAGTSSYCSNLRGQPTGCCVAASSREAPTLTPRPTGANLPCEDSENCILDTAIGEIDPTPAPLVSFLIRTVLGFMGLILIFISIYAGYTMMFSRGDAEQLASARRMLTAGVIGILFVAFSLVLYEIIARIILRLPGF